MLWYFLWELRDPELWTFIFDRILFRASTSVDMASGLGDDSCYLVNMLRFSSVYSLISRENRESCSKFIGVCKDGDIVFTLFEGVGLVSCVDIVLIDKYGCNYLRSTRTSATLSSLFKFSTGVSRLIIKEAMISLWYKFEEKYNKCHLHSLDIEMNVLARG